eukprot:ANDGO_06373.mRNA.1 hypothetical protein
MPGVRSQSRARSLCLFELLAPDVQARFRDMMEDSEWGVFSVDAQGSARVLADHDADGAHAGLLVPVDQDMRLYRVVRRNLLKWGLPEDLMDNVAFGDMFILDDYRGAGIFFAADDGSERSPPLFVRTQMEYGYMIPVELWPLVLSHGPVYFAPWTQTGNLQFAEIPKPENAEQRAELEERYPPDDELYDPDVPEDSAQYGVSWEGSTFDDETPAELRLLRGKLY